MQASCQAATIVHFQLLRAFLRRLMAQTVEILYTGFRVPRRFFISANRASGQDSRAAVVADEDAAISRFSKICASSITCRRIPAVARARTFLLSDQAAPPSPVSPGVKFFDTLPARKAVGRVSGTLRGTGRRHRWCPVWWGNARHSKPLQKPSRPTRALVRRRTDAEAVVRRERDDLETGRGSRSAAIWAANPDCARCRQPLHLLLPIRTRNS